MLTQNKVRWQAHSGQKGCQAGWRSVESNSHHVWKIIAHTSNQRHTGYLHSTKYTQSRVIMQCKVSRMKSEKWLEWLKRMQISCANSASVWSLSFWHGRESTWGNRSDWERLAELWMRSSLTFRSTSPTALQLCAQIKLSQYVLKQLQPTRIIQSQLWKCWHDV